jgi:hypothetical protein
MKNIKKLLFALILGIVAIQSIQADLGDILVPTAIGGAVGGGRGAAIGAGVGLGLSAIHDSERGYYDEPVYTNDYDYDNDYDRYEGRRVYRTYDRPYVGPYIGIGF